MRARSEHTDALVLRCVDYGEADRVVTLLTRRHGKLAVLARSARRSRRRFGGSLEPFCLLDAEVSLGSADLGHLCSASVTRAFPALLRDLSRMQAAGAALELVREASAERSPDPLLFASVVALLEALDRGEVAPRRLLVSFAAHAMSLLGLAPQLASCVSCGKRPRPEQAAELDPARGGLLCRACGGGALRLSGAARALLRGAQGAGWQEAAASDCSAEPIAEAERALARLLEHHLPRPPSMLSGLLCYNLSGHGSHTDRR